MYLRVSQVPKRYDQVIQMLDDVRLAVNGAVPVEFFGRFGGVVPTAEEMTQQILKKCEALS